LERDRPQERIASSGISNAPAGVSLPAARANRSHTDCAAFTDICWPTMERTSVWNASPLVRRLASGWALMMLRRTLSRRARCCFASLQ
jgi:hypothetical protein